MKALNLKNLFIRSNQYSFILIVVLLLIGCQDNDFENSSENVSSSEHNQSSTISIEEAKAIAINFLNKIEPTTRSMGCDVSDVLVWHSKEFTNTTRSTRFVSELPDTMIYIVNFENEQGYVLVSAKRKCSGVLAYIEEGHFAPTEEIDNPGFKIFLNGVSKLLADNTRDMGFGGGLMPHDPVPMILSIPKLIQTKWHQRSPFNDQCPVINGDHCLAGCGPIATAQVIAYYQTPASYNGYVYNWDSISVSNKPTTQIGMEGAAHLVHNIGLIENADYGTQATGVTPTDIEMCLDSLGYWHFSTGYMYELVHASLVNQHPLIIIGYTYNHSNGHAWIIDGLYEEVYSNGVNNGPDLPQDLYYVHCNWGWNGKCNGYYYSGVFDTQAQQLSDNFPMMETIPNETISYDLSYSLQLFSNVCPD